MCRVIPTSTNTQLRDEVISAIRRFSWATDSFAPRRRVRQASCVVSSTCCSRSPQSSGTVPALGQASAAKHAIVGHFLESTTLSAVFSPSDQTFDDSDSSRSGPPNLRRLDWLQKDLKQATPAVVQGQKSESWG